MTTTTRSTRTATAATMLNKVPEVTIYFWIIKILCTTVGETAADFLNSNLKLGLTNSLYGGAFNSRLGMNIREDKGYTYSPRSGVNPLRQYGYFSVSAAVRNDVVAASLAEIFYELDKLRSLPVPEAELLDAQNYLTGVFSMGLATQSGLLSQISTLALYDLPDDYLETYRETVRALKPEDVLSGARTYFDSANMQIVVVGDRKQIEAQATLFGDLAIFSAAGARIS